MTDNKKPLVFPPYSLDFFPEENTKQKSINELRISNPNWYRRHRRIATPNDTLLDDPHKIAPTTNKWKELGIPETSTDSFASHTPFSTILLQNDRRRKDPVTGKYCLTANTRVALEEVHQRLYGTRRDDNPFRKAQTTKDAVKERILVHDTVDCFNSENSRRLTELEGFLKTTSGDRCQIEKQLVTQDADVRDGAKAETAMDEFGEEQVIEADASSTGALPSGANVYKVVPELSSKQDRLAPTQGNTSHLEMGNLPRNKQVESQNAYLSEKDVEEIQSRNAIEETSQKVTDVTLDGADLMPTLASSSIPPKSQNVLVSQPTYIRCVLSQSKSENILESAPMYHPLVWKAQLQHDHYNLYPDPPPKDKTKFVKNILEVREKFGDYHYLEKNPNLLKTRTKLFAKEEKFKLN